MHRILFSVLTVTLLVFSACKGSADGKAPELASDMCKCFESMQREVSPAVLALYKDVAKAPKPSTALQMGIAKLETEEAESIRTSMMEIQNKGSKINQCIEAYDRKYAKETTRDKNGLLRKVLAEMQKNTSCPIGAAVMNLGIERQGIE